MTEIAYARFPDSVTWSAKTPRINANGSFHLFGNDMARGLDVYRFNPTAEPSDGASTWLGAAELPELGEASLPAGYRPYCLLRGAA
jgi:hypothetical protein